MLASVVIRTYNEEKYLEQLLIALENQVCEIVDLEIVIIDSGSTDKTLEIAARHRVRVTHINKKDFTFGRSLNEGCTFAQGDILVFISGHCIPTNEFWLDEICKPILSGDVEYTYGKQEGKDTTKFSEYRHFEKWFPNYSKIPQKGFFCNNANAAIKRSTWLKYKFDEELTGLEDMSLAKSLTEDGGKVGYVSTASVYHIHDETWKQVKIRYEREAYALHKIIPEVHFGLFDFYRFFISSVVTDSKVAIEKKVFVSKIGEIILFRFNHYWGTYIGNSLPRNQSKDKKFKYFHPKDLDKENYL